jgi:hypothetical protein
MAGLDGLEGSFAGRDVTLRHYESAEDLARSWAPWATRLGVRKLVTKAGKELWPNMDPSLSVPEEDDGTRDQ